MTATAVDPATIEALDFDIPCAADGDTAEQCPIHEHPADWYVATHCSGAMPICDTALRLDQFQSVMCGDVHCIVCGAIYLTTPYRVLGPVRA